MERAAFSVFSKAIPSSGYIGCNSSSKMKQQSRANVLKLPHDDWSAMHYEHPLLIFPSDQNLDWVLGQSRQDNRVVDTDDTTLVGDVLFVSGSQTPLMTLVDHVVDEQTLSLLGNQTGALEEMAFVSLNDCHYVATFQTGQSIYDKDTDTTHLSYGKSVASNCTAIDEYGNDTGQVLLGTKAGEKPGCHDNETRSKFSAYHFHSGSQLTVVKAEYYYLAYPSSRNDGTPSLYRASMDNDGLPGTASEIITGVENFRLFYGIRRTSDQAIRYVTAKNFKGEGDIDQDGDIETGKHISAIRIHLLLRSQSEKGGKGFTRRQIYVFPNIEGVPIRCDDNTIDRTACPFFTHKDNDEKSRYRRPIELSFFIRNST